MIDYGNEKLNQIFRDTWPNLGWAKRMNEFAGNYEGPLYARHPNLPEPGPYPDEMFEEAERREKSNRILQRYNDFHNLETSGLPHGTPITPEHQQIIAMESMIDAIRCEYLNREYNHIAIEDIEGLIEGLRNQANEFLERVKNNG